MQLTVKNYALPERGHRRILARGDGVEPSCTKRPINSRVDYHSPHPRINQLSAGCPDPICTGTKRVRASCAAVTLQGNYEIQQDTLLLHFVCIFRRRCLELKSKNSIRYFFVALQLRVFHVRLSERRISSHIGMAYASRTRLIA